LAIFSIIVRPKKLDFRGQDLKEAGCPPGKVFSVVLQKLRDHWKAADFEIGKDELLKLLPAIIDDIDPSDLSPKRQKLDKKVKS
jgi:hypothetical protein